ncbi:MAG: PP2C family protein-serine/threonine phosphatase [Thermoanaerobaculia bacterium]|nr:PP2C family protein-serine/threonine phosphatase [Thermoanaerobaculia bacterium]
MRELIDRAAWLMLAVLGGVLFVWALPRALPLMPETPTVGPEQAEELAREALAQFAGPLSEGLRSSVRLEHDSALERRLIGDLGRAQLKRIRSERLGRLLTSWQVRLEERDGRLHRVRVTLRGEIMSVRAALDGGGTVLAEKEAIRDAYETLEPFVDLSVFESAFVVRNQGRPDSLEVRFPVLQPSAALDGLSYGIGVYFEGRRVAGWGTWLTDTRAHRNETDVDSWNVLHVSRLATIGVLFLLLATSFYRYYDAGKLRLRRSLHLAALVVAAGFVWAWTAEVSAARPMGMALVVLFVALMAFLTFLTTGVGDAVARGRWHHRLAAFEALCRGDFRNATVARAGLHGLCGGIFLGGASLALAVPLRWYGAGPLAGQVLEQSFLGTWPGVAALSTDIFLRLVPHLLLLLVLVPLLMHRLGANWGSVASLVASALMITPPVQPVPLAQAVPWLLVVSALPLFLFFYSDLLASVVAAVLARMLVVSCPLLLSDNTWMNLGGAATLALVITGPLVSMRWLGSERSFTYQFDPVSDVPGDVLQRIRERERQRVELETGRQIQAAILPQLADEVRGVEVAHAFTPATEIGGDFYHVLPLDDSRRLAVALGDVAGHGVASGLVMSAVRGALEVHLHYEPDVPRVFRSINRLLYEGGGLRMLTTLAYGVLDPVSGELTFAGAGQIWWIVRAGGEVEEIQPAVYPLGVRAECRVEVRSLRLGSGDAVFLASDGVAEACNEREEPFGYDRVVEALRRSAGGGARDILDAVRLDVADHVGACEAEDDRTFLVLKLP